MQKLTPIDQQISKLQEKKKQLESKQAVWLYKHLQKIAGTDFSEDFVLGLITWAKSEMKNNPEMKEVWVNASHKFRKSVQAKN